LIRVGERAEQIEKFRFSVASVSEIDSNPLLEDSVSHGIDLSISASSSL
jgi:hypothetical protein